jgi:hypothetical protein
MTKGLTNMASTLLVAAALPLMLASTIKYDVPAGWTTRPVTSSMRVAEFALPKVAGDAEDGQLTLYYFGGQGGTVQANLDRWIGQIAQPDGRPSKDVATTTMTNTKSGLLVALVDVSGTYVAEVTPGSKERFNKPGFRLRAAVVETPSGPYFAKLTGPAKTVAKWSESYLAFVKSLRIDPTRSQ